MKLLDLQTGKYLELGKDFLYGGNFIIIEPYNIASNIMCFFLECFKDANSIEEGMIFLQKKALQNKQNNISDDVIMNVLHKSEPQEPLKTLCETTGAVVYGGRYVLLNEIEVWVYNNDLPPTHIKTGDIVLHTPRRGYDTEILVNTNDFCTKLGSNHNKITFYLKDENLNFDDYGFFRIQKIHGNIFEEFAKKEHGLENKFDELQSEIMI